MTELCFLWAISGVSMWALVLVQSFIKYGFDNFDLVADTQTTIICAVLGPISWLAYFTSGYDNNN